MMSFLTTRPTLLPAILTSTPIPWAELDEHQRDAASRAVVENGLKLRQLHHPVGWHVLVELSQGKLWAQIWYPLPMSFVFNGGTEPEPMFILAPTPDESVPPAAG